MDENKQAPGAGEDSTQDPEQGAGAAQDPEQPEGGAPQDGGKGEAARRQDNPHKLERDLANARKRVAELEAAAAEREKAGKTAEERIADLEAKFAESQKRLADERTASALTGAGCIDVKAARARLEDFGNDVGKLKSECPYLFGRGGSQGASTGGEPAGKSDVEETARLRRLAGLPEKKKD